MALSDLIDRLKGDVDPDDGELARAVCDFCGTPHHPDILTSIDAARAFMDDVFRISIITVSWDPSGEGCKLVWYPRGLSGATEIMTEGAHYYAARAMILAGMRAYAFVEMDRRIDEKLGVTTL